MTTPCAKSNQPVSRTTTRNMKSMCNVSGLLLLLLCVVQGVTSTDPPITTPQVSTSTDPPITTPQVSTSADPTVMTIPSDESITACVGDYLSLMCITKGFPTGYWMSGIYIGDGGQRLEFGPPQPINSALNSTVEGSDAMATFVDTYEENGLTVIKIQLQFTVSVAAELICGAEGREKQLTLILGQTCATTTATTDTTENTSSTQKENNATLTTGRGCTSVQGYIITGILVLVALFMA